MPLLLQRNPLAYPAGRPPGFDPTHPAAQSIQFSGIATSGGGFVSLLNGAAATPTGSPTTIIDGSIGPSFYGTGTQYETFSGLAQSSKTQGTLAAIINPTGNSGNTAIVSNSTGISGISIRLTSGVFTGVYTGSAARSSGITCALNTPYFVVASLDVSAGVNMLVCKLQTGQIATGTGAGTNPYRVPTSGSLYVGQYEVSAPFVGKIAAGMWNEIFMSMPQLLAWAARPWDFWYPPHIDDYLFNLEVAVGIGAPPPSSPPQNPGKMMVIHFPGVGSR